MNQNLKDITLKRGYIGIISIENFLVNIFQIYATQPLGYCLMEKYGTFRIKIGNDFFFERNISNGSHLNKLYSKKEKNVRCE